MVQVGLRSKASMVFIHFQGTGVCPWWVWAGERKDRLGSA